MSGVDFIFIDINQYAFYLQGKYPKKLEYDDLKIEKLLDFLSDNKIDLGQSINRIKVKIKTEHGRSRSEPLKNVLDFVDNERYCLMNGKWYQFNQSYIDYLKKEVDKIEIISHDQTRLPDDISEEQFNLQMKNEGYLYFDKNFTYKENFTIEKMDLYRDNILYFVKFGVPQNLGYVIDQCISTVKILQNNEDAIEINGQKITPKNMCLWLIMERKRPINKISDIRSLIFLMKLVEWKRTVTIAGYTPNIQIGYRNPRSK